MALREGLSFQEATSPIMRDFDRFSEYTCKEEVAIKRTASVTKSSTDNRGSDLNKGYGKSKGKFSSRFQPYSKSKWPDSSWSAPSRWNYGGHQQWGRSYHSAQWDDSQADARNGAKQK